MVLAEVTEPYQDENELAWNTLEIRLAALAVCLLLLLSIILNNYRVVKPKKNFAFVQLSLIASAIWIAGCSSTIKSPLYSPKPSIYRNLDKRSVVIRKIHPAHSVPAGQSIDSRQFFNGKDGFSAKLDRSVTEIVHEALQAELTQFGMTCLLTEDHSVQKPDLILDCAILSFMINETGGGFFKPNNFSGNVSVGFAWYKGSDGKLLSSRSWSTQYNAKSYTGAPLGVFDTTALNTIANTMVNQMLPQVIRMELSAMEENRKDP